ncbi:hypothetical protein [Sulfuracidifex metallicus]|uniref:Uncharacterized protein n=1 Tax=Sulfuracidifex metallicus DSM 6482 = JCM 9184 TaxID=523847 RepID=A0A6A9QSV9_SULME|nr:hypothetical protein [Sulfuracidifex metallicus]MUN28853.1 hypothetical protein [Sulfuracidifex metallicus DSM 6482 = JCM 9184]WOE50634.1 hypothetical protein RQ359_002185 [Sulfuracidifex metallicus DSM 6482 = JCM 9184]
MESILARNVKYTDENGFETKEKPCKGFAIYTTIIPTNSIKEVSIFKIDGCKEQYLKSFDNTDDKMSIVTDMENLPQGLVNVVLQTLK